MVAERGYDNVSLRDVAEALDMSKGTILHHFGSKDSLLEHVHSDYMERRLAEAHSLLARIESPPDQLAALIYQLMLAEHHDRSATVAFAREIVRFASDEIMSDVRRMRDEYTGLLRGVVQRGMDAGPVRRGQRRDRDAADLRHVQLELDLVPARGRLERRGHRGDVHARDLQRAGQRDDDRAVRRRARRGAGHDRRARRGAGRDRVAGWLRSMGA